MASDDLTIEILKQIRDSVRESTERIEARIDATNTRLDATNTRLDRMDLRLDRVERGLVDLGQFMRQIALDRQRHEAFHHKHVDLLEKDMVDLKDRVSRLEAQAGRAPR